MFMKTMAVSEFKAHALQVLGDVDLTHEPVLITKRGKPLAKVIPISHEEEKKPLLGRLAGSIIGEGDIISPIDAEWNACQ